MAIDASSERFSEDSNGSMVDYPASLLRRLIRCPASVGMTVRDGSEWVSAMHRNHCPECCGIRNSLNKLFEKATFHVQAGVEASRQWPIEIIPISILLEHEKALIELRSKLEAHEERVGEGNI